MKTQLFVPEIDNITDGIKWETAPINQDVQLLRSERQEKY